ncbi:MAG: Gfo/Idh/MocA family oxidoreductase [Kiritimatiellae bacterium]|nr:Gfo/Idh/MocA family oxidoreductase [Kiritimatiellia bacterium]
MKLNRRSLLKGIFAAGAAPVIVPASVFGSTAPSNKVQIAIIGCGRIGTTMDVCGMAQNEDIAMLTTVCDCDAVRLANMKAVAERFYRHKMDHLKFEMDYRKVLDDPGVDGVMICTPDHWHARMAVEACLKGKDIYVQKPIAFSIEESLAIQEAVRRTKRIFYTGTQQRSEHFCGNGFRRATEYIKSGRIGKLVRIETGIIDNSPAKEWDVPSMEETPDKRDFDFDMWLGPARDDVRYSQLRTHWRPVDANGVPYAKIPGQNVGWLQIQDYCTGHVSGWGTHMVDSAQWPLDEAMPVSVKAEIANFMHGRLFNVHDHCLITYKYANGVEMQLGTPRASNFKIGVRYIGENGDWIYANRFVSRIPEKDRVDTAYKPKADIWRQCESNKKEIIEGEPTVHVPRNDLKGHHRIWFVCMRERKDTNIPVEATCSSTISCILGYHALNNPGRTIEWDPIKCKFKDPSDEKNLRNCFMRPQFSAIEALKEIRKRG